MQNDAHLIAENVLVADNIAEGDGSYYGAVVLFYGYADLTNVTITENHGSSTAAAYGAGLFEWVVTGTSTARRGTEL